MPKVFVALSGGVDSAVSAALLKKAGFDVTGIFLKCWNDKTPSCSMPADERTARIVASFLKIHFSPWDFTREYQEKVLDYLIKGYKKGLTPNPDVVCNHEIKFGLFFKRALSQGADFVATGHYARIKNGKILKGQDKNKDQSYFLATINPRVLNKTLFPVGDYTKFQVRQIAKKLGLPNAARHSSQGLCFVGQVDFVRFLKNYLPTKRGVIVDLKGQVLGQHQGALFYTIGQRHGLRLSGGPYFVVKKNIKKNLLIVSKNEKDLRQKEIFVSKINWFSKPKKFPTKIGCKIRYRQPDAKAVIRPVSNKGVFKVVFSKPQRAIAPGQFAVFYQGSQMIGGGVIL